MKLTEPTAAALLEAFARLIDGGTVDIYSGSPPLVFQAKLASIPLGHPALVVTDRGLAVGMGPLSSVVLATGEAGWAQLVSQREETVAELTAGTAPGNDLVLERTDFHRGGQCTITDLTLRLPLRS